MNIYVGNLAYTVTEEDLQKLFEQYGEVESARIITLHSGKSKGFGFVTMPKDEEAKTAIEALNGTDLQGRPMTVNEARPKEDRPERSQDRRGGGGFRGHSNNSRGGDRNRRFSRGNGGVDRY